MKNIFCWCKRLLLVCILFFSQKASATHIYGADFFYTYVSGRTYTISLVVYGDCAGSALSTLYGATPTVEVYNGSTFVTDFNLTQQGTSTGVEVTPVCPSQLSNTNCVSSTGTVPGVKRFVYTADYTLSNNSPNWRFRFDGQLTSVGQAGRSTTISNIATSGSSVMALETTINDTSVHNSSPSYTTIPTPFFCINIPANYNPGTVDANGDSLSNSLVPGLLGNGVGGTVTYLTGYSSTAPLACSTGTFSFSATTGQLAFTPNMVQRSLVVTKVEEYKNGVLVGTSMREMTFVVINTCSNNPPTGSISSQSAGTLNSAGTILTVCKSNNTLTFNINPTDVEGDTIKMAWSGIPAGVTFSVTNNNTLAPTSSFSWNLTSVAPGSYNFFVTYTDNGCPLSSKQTLAYTIVVLPIPSVSYALVAEATCAKKAVFDMTPSGGASPWSLVVLQGISTVHTFTGVTAIQRDSLVPGTYTLRVTHAGGCRKDTAITITSPPAITPSVTMVKPTCYADTNGSITITGTGGKTPFTYALGSGSYSSTNTFTSLTAGTYVLHILDANDCRKDTTVTLQQPPEIAISVAPVRPRCNYKSNGVITVTATNGVVPYQYALGSGSFGGSNNFTPLPAATYIVHVKDANNCKKDTTLTLTDSIVVHASAVVTDVLCNNNATGAITITGNSGTSPYMYKLGSGSLSGTNTFTSLAAATYNIHVQDVDSCYLDTAIAIVQPTAITVTAAKTNASCFGVADGSITINSAGGVGTHNYAIGAGSYGSSNVFTGLAAGSYTIHTKDANNCIKDTTITITQPVVLSISNIAIVEPSCNSTATGSITLTAVGGTTPYSYAINAGAFGSSATFSSIAAGTYIMHLKDNNGCTADSTVSVGQPTPIIPAAQVKHSTCSPVNNGQVTLYAAGGVPVYKYAWGIGTFGTSNVFTNVPAGTYTFRIMDTRNCIKDTIITVKDSTKVTGTYTIGNVKCNAGNSGLITATAVTGESPFTYAINTNPYSAVNMFTGLTAGSYIVKIKDDLGCGKDTTIAIAEPAAIVPTASVNNVTCFGLSNGSVFLNGSGGTSPYTFANGSGTYAASGSFTGLAAGSYTFHIKDVNNCLKDTTISIIQPTKLLIDSVSVKEPLCYNDKNGQITIHGSGGTPTYTYSSNGTTFLPTNPLTGFGAGAAVISLRDVNNCRVDTIVILNQPAKVSIAEAEIISPTCEGFTDASVKLTGAGGTAPYQYAIGNGALGSGNTFSQLTEGTHSFSVQDANGCRYDTTITLVGYPHISIVELDLSPVKCYGFADGEIMVRAGGGVIPYRFQLGTGTPGPDNTFKNLSAGNYIITIYDSKNCTKDTAVTIESPDKLKIETTATPNDCEGYDNGGLVHAEVTGGTTPYNYKWSDAKGSSTADVGGVANGPYSVFVSDANGCKDSATAMVLYDDCCRIFIPDAFTPNGDGRNDYAKILVKGDFRLQRFAIYNRFGEAVFETTDISQGWNGFYKGVPQDLGTYNYYAVGACGNGTARNVEYKGTITLVK